MYDIIKMLDNENPLITLTDECDIICENCPKNIDGKCTDNNKVSRIDEKVIAELSLAFGDKIRWNELKELSFNEIINKKKIDIVCGNCAWKDLCK